MDVRCMHFCQEYRKNQSNTYDLIGIFNTLSTDSFPWRYDFKLYVLLDVDEADRPYRHPIAVRMSGGARGSVTLQEHVTIKEGRRVQRPHIWWVIPVEAQFEEPGYYKFEVLLDGVEIAGDRILVRDRRHPVPS